MDRTKLGLPNIPNINIPNIKGPRARDLLTPRDLEGVGGPDDGVQGWCLPSFTGRLGEVSGARDSARLSLVFRLVREAQRQGEPVAWIARKDSIFYPPDVADLSVDVEALIVVWASRPILAAKAADQLVRSGGFGLVVLDLPAEPKLSLPSLSRLAGLAKKHQTAVLFLTEKGVENDSLGSLISLRTQAERRWEDDGKYRCRIRVLKDKRFGPGFVHEETCHGPDGLR